MLIIYSLTENAHFSLSLNWQLQIARNSRSRILVHRLEGLWCVHSGLPTPTSGLPVSALYNRTEWRPLSPLIVFKSHSVLQLTGETQILLIVGEYVQEVFKNLNLPCINHLKWREPSQPYPRGCKLNSKTDQLRNHIGALPSLPPVVFLRVTGYVEESDTNIIHATSCRIGFGCSL